MDSIAKPIQLIPIEYSHTDNAIEEDLNRLFIDLFNTKLVNNVQDVNALGMMQMGTAELLKKAIATHGLIMINGINEEDNSRHLYKAWMAQNESGRGFHFLKLYLQLVFPNVWTLNWFSQRKTNPYPTALAVKDDSDPNFYQTSRISINVDADIGGRALPLHMNTIQSILPARIVPRFALLAKGSVELVVASVVRASMTMRIIASVSDSYAELALTATANPSMTIHINATTT